MISLFYASLLIFLYFLLSIEVIKGRHKHKVSLGAGENNEIIHLVSGHSNFSSYVPIFLICLFLIENQSFFPIVIHLLGTAFFIGRVLHYLSMKNQEKTFKHRKTSMMLTFWPLLISGGIGIFIYVKSLFA